jgi:hypothetical protein
MPAPPEIRTAGRVVRAVVPAVCLMLAKSREWDKPQEAVQVVTVIETAKMAPSVEAMIAIEAMTHAKAAMHGEIAMAPGERVAAEAATAYRSRHGS